MPHWQGVKCSLSPPHLKCSHYLMGSVPAFPRNLIRTDTLTVQLRRALLSHHPPDSLQMEALEEPQAGVHCRFIYKILSSWVLRTECFEQNASEDCDNPGTVLLSELTANLTHPLRAAALTASQNSCWRAEAAHRSLAPLFVSRRSVLTSWQGVGDGQ